MFDQVLIVEDEVKLANLLNDYLSQSGFNCHVINEGLAVVDWVKTHQPDIILLDLMLPGKSGIDVCKEIRQFSDVPVFMLTAKVEEIDRLLGLELGADDYICKPYSPREVVARVKAMMRRQSLRASKAEATTDNTNLLTLDQNQYRINWQGCSVELTAVEFNLIKHLYKEPGRIFHRDQLMSQMYDDNRIVSHRTIDSHIKKLRKKLIEIDPTQELIQSVYGVGYKLVL